TRSSWDLIGYYPAEGVIFNVAGDDVIDITLLEADPILSVDPETFDFGVVVLNNQTDPQTFTSMNVGGDGLVINDVTFDDPSGQFILDDLNDYTGGLSLNTGEQITFDIAFAPIIEGPAMATATIHYNDGADKTFDVVVNGDGYDPAITEFPWLEDFEGDEFPPLGWNVINVGDGGTQWVVSDAQNITPGGSQSALHSYSSEYYQEGWLITPAIEMPVDNVYKLSFSSFNLFPGDYEKNSVLISVGSPNPVDGDFVEIWSPGSVSNEWVETIESLEAYAGETIYIAFVYEGDNAHAWYLDDVAISEIESYTVDFSVVGGNGDLTATANSTDITSGDAVQEGSEVVFSAIPDDGFAVLEWTVDGVPVDGFTEEVLTIESLTANVSVTVEFEEMQIVYPLPFFDDFETYVDTDDFVANSDWSIVDADGDGNNWYLHYDDVDEINVMASRSWDADAGPLTPENYLITPALEIPELTEENDIIQLSYVVTAGGSNYFEEHYKVVVSTTGNAPEDFIDANIVLEETLTVDESGWNFTLREVDLSDFQNEVIYIAFVHYDCTDMDRLIIKEVGVSVETIVEPVYYTVTFDVEGANGAIEASVDGTAISSGDMVEEGKDVLFTATPDTDYIVKAWYLDGTAIDGETDETYTYTALDADIDVKVEFEYSNFIDDISVADVNVYPNPANSNATIESDVVIKEITIVGLLGDVIFKQEVGDTVYNVDVSNFVNGIYFIRVATENGLITKRLQVSR
ncbi:MAG: choice-of-anchor J domain-containing protein, partial [Bacteroidales bacterium]